MSSGPSTGSTEVTAIQVHAVAATAGAGYIFTCTVLSDSCLMSRLSDWESLPAQDLGQ